MNFESSILRLLPLDLTNVYPSEKFVEDKEKTTQQTDDETVLEEITIPSLGAIPIYSVQTPIPRAGGLSRELENWIRLKDLPFKLMDEIKPLEEVD